MIRRRDHRQITNGHRSEKFPMRPHRVGVLEPHGTLEQCTLVAYIHDRTGYTTIFVTHDQGEALELADRIVVLNNGSIEQTGHAGRDLRSPVSVRLWVHWPVELPKRQRFRPRDLA